MADTITEARFVGRPILAEYEQVFGFRSKDLQGKRVLDLGSSTDDFARFLKAIYPKDTNVDVVSLEHRELDKRIEERSEHVWGEAQSLPFKSETFDYIFAHLSVPMWILGTENFKQMEFTEQNLEEAVTRMKRVLDEAARVLKHGGIAKFSPWHVAIGLHPKSWDEMDRRLTEKLLEETSESEIYDFSMRKDGMGGDMGQLVKK